MPAAAVIPAPIAYVNVVEFKKLVVEFLARRTTLRLTPSRSSAHDIVESFTSFSKDWAFYLEEIKVFQAGFRLNTPAWNNGIGLGLFSWSIDLVMINRNSWGRLYLVVRGEILRFTKDTLMRKHSPRMFSLIKNESAGIQND